MNRNAEVPDLGNLIADPAVLKKLLIAQARARGRHQGVRLQNARANLVKKTFEALLEFEMEEHLG
ncbi:MAG TPA: hypothetical protein VKV17_02910 [Bryobacteraceae bacterium]|nr:hypothetical protein [Bryobacteraceae bacterium]